MTVSAAEPQIQVVLGTPEAVGAMEANLQIARTATRQAQKALKESPNDPGVQSAFASAKVAEATAKSNLDAARAAYAATRRAIRAQRRYYR